MHVGRITDLIGRTPVVEISHLFPAATARLFLKLEGYNPGGSIKDRPALNVIRRAEERGLLKPGGTIVESSSGNFGVALAIAAAERGYRCVILVDPRTNKYNVKLLRALGADVVMVTEKDADGTYQTARIKRARELADSLPGAYMPWQYGNPWNPEAHAATTAPEILEDFPQGLAAVVGTVSTGGHISGIGKAVRAGSPGTRVVGVDVKGSVVFGGARAPTPVTGMGLAWTPENLDEQVIDDAYVVDAEPCFLVARLLARRTGIMVGGSSGAALFVGLKLAHELPANGGVLVVCPDRGEKYLDEFFDDEWMLAHGYPVDVSLVEIAARARELRIFRNPRAECEAVLPA